VASRAASLAEEDLAAGPDVAGRRAVDSRRAEAAHELHQLLNLLIGKSKCRHVRPGDTLADETEQILITGAPQFIRARKARPVPALSVYPVAGAARSGEQLPPRWLGDRAALEDHDQWNQAARRHPLDHSKS
jgi:hypothetical protein